MLIPDNISEFNSIGEKLLYNKFKLDGSSSSMFILHSVFTNYHLKNISGELDFLVLAPKLGFFCIEVKHGGVSRKNGEWCFTNRYGETTCKKIGPFAQQSATMNSIRKYVLDKIKHKKKLHQRLEKVVWGSGVAFTSMNQFIDFGPEGHSWQVLTKHGLRHPISQFIETLSKGTHKEHSDKFWYDSNHSRPSVSDCEDVLNILRGDFDINYSEINRIIDGENLIEEYTKEQFSLLDFVNYNPRCLIEGTAGTGKTLMAIEITRRKCDNNLKVGLFCFNKQLGAKLKKSTESIPIDENKLKYVGNLHNYLTHRTNSRPSGKEPDLHKYYSEELPMDFLIEHDGMDENEKFDVLILDEAQDLLSPYYLEIFDLILKGGLQNGSWVVFGDFANQAIYLNDPISMVEKLGTFSNFVRFPPLKINCRNTKQIASQNTLLTGCELGEFGSRTSQGNNVSSQYVSRSDQPSVIRDILLKIEKRGIPLDKVTLLSPKKFKNSILGKYKPVKELIQKGTQFNTIQGFKGLENTIIILYDFDEVSTMQMQKLLYVGISRARQELFMVFDKNLKNAVSELIAKNYPKLN